MYKSGKLNNLQGVQKKFFKAIENFIGYYNSEVDKGNYLTFIESENDTITFKVGAETFTVRSQLYLNTGKIVFKIYAWV